LGWGFIYARSGGWGLRLVFWKLKAWFLQFLVGWLSGIVMMFMGDTGVAVVTVVSSDL